MLWLLFFLSFIANAQTIKFKIRDTNITESEIRQQLALYPPKLLAEYLDSVIVMTESGMCGRAFIAKTIELNGLCPNRELAYVIHHEISSVFLQRFDIYVQPVYNELWRRFVQLNGQYSYTFKTEPIYIDPDTELADYYYKNKYAQRDFENDFNIIAESLFMEGKEVLELAERFPEKPISKKIWLVIDFYKKLDPLFTVDFFKRRGV